MSRVLQSRLRRLSMPARVFLALGMGAVAVALMLGLLEAERSGRQERLSQAQRQREFAVQLAERAAPLVQQRDLLRLSMLATAARDLHDARVLLLDQQGRVMLDTGLVLGDRRLSLLATSGPLQRTVDQPSGPALETLAPVRFGGETLGEVRLQTAPPSVRVAFDSGLFGLVLLAGLALAAAAAALARGWAARLRSLTSSVVQLAAGQPTQALQRDTTREVEQLSLALTELERGVQDGMRRVVDEFVQMCLQAVDGLERQGLVPTGHGARTARYAMLLADRLELQPADRHDVELACRLSDLGRACIAPSLLRKQRLSEEESATVRSHPQLAAQRLDCLPGLRRAAQILRHSGERPDGLGVPDGLRNDRIPLGSRMLAIASAFDLWTTCGEGRPLGPQAALLRMAEDRGEAFDPWLFDLFAEAVRAAPPEEVAGEAAADKAVMILPAGGLPQTRPNPALEAQGYDYDLAQELELLLDDLPPEERP